VGVSEARLRAELDACLVSAGDTGEAPGCSGLPDPVSGFSSLPDPFEPWPAIEDMLDLGEREAE
jgi:hypothetical protein